MASEPPIELPEDVILFAKAQVAAGRYASVAAVLQAGVRALASREHEEAEWLRRARSKWNQGIEASERGESAEMNAAEFSEWLDGC